MALQWLTGHRLLDGWENNNVGRRQFTPATMVFRYLAGCGKTQFLLKIHCDFANGDAARTARRMLKMAVQRGP